jgi:hypothetical protein
VLVSIDSSRLGKQPMKALLRLVLLGVIVILGFTVVFPEWFDFKDQVIAEKREEAFSKDQAQRDVLARERHRELEARLRTLEPEAAALAERIWKQVEAGTYGAPFQHATERMRAQLSQADAARLQNVYDAMGAELSLDTAQSKPGFNSEKLGRVYLQTGMSTLICESSRWSENAMLKRTLELKLEQDQLKVDALLLEVFLYPDQARSLPDSIVRPHIFR